MIPRVVETPSELRRHAGRIKRGYDAFAGRHTIVDGQTQDFSRLGSRSLTARSLLA